MHLFLSVSTAEVQRGPDQSQVPVDSRGKPCDPQQGPHLGEVRRSRYNRSVLCFSALYGHVIEI